jgi:hypothetical protein
MTPPTRRPGCTPIRILAILATIILLGILLQFCQRCTRAYLRSYTAPTPTAALLPLPPRGPLRTAPTSTPPPPQRPAAPPPSLYPPPPPATRPPSPPPGPSPTPIPRTGHPDWLTSVAHWENYLNTAAAAASATDRP